MNQPVYVYGAGGHGKVVADILFCLGKQVAGFIDDGKQAGIEILSVPVVGGRQWLLDILKTAPILLALGIGNNHVRREVAEWSQNQGCTLVTAVHPSAVVSRSAQVMEGAVIMAGAIVNPEAHIGRGAVINTGAVVDHDAVVSDFAQVMPNAALAGASQLGPEANLGTGASIIPLVRVGARATIGAGAVVIRDIPDNVVAVGVPAVVRSVRCK